jgi:hypothetical protein
MARLGRGTSTAADAHRSAQTAPPAPTGNGAAPVIGREGGPAGPEITGQIQSRRGQGRPLDAGIRQDMEGAFGADFGHVRIHTDAGAARLNSSLSAGAFTIGSDVFFGKGAYRPDTPHGRHTIAHELAHTVQQGSGSGSGSGARRSTVRRYALENPAPIDFSNTREIKTISSGQAVFFFTDNINTIVIKGERIPIGRAQLAAGVLRDVGQANAVRIRDVPSSQKNTVLGQITDPALTTDASWKRLGNANIVTNANHNQGSPEANAREHHRQQLVNLPKIHAMAVAEGETAKTLAKPGGTPGGWQGNQSGQGHPLRAWLGNKDYVYNLGIVSAVDFFMNNGDRVLAPNLGNWTTAASGAITLIDNVDAGTNSMFAAVDTDIDDLDMISRLKKARLRTTATELAAALVTGMQMEGDATAADWAATAKGAGKTYTQFMEENLLAGIKDARAKLIRRFATQKRSAKGRAAKRGAVGTQQKDVAAGHVPQRDYWETLKARGRWLNTH